MNDLAKARELVDLNMAVGVEVFGNSPTILEGDWKGYTNHQLPYSTDPAAADRVMEWLRQQFADSDEDSIELIFPTKDDPAWTVFIFGVKYRSLQGIDGSTWMETICKAALALVRARGTQENDNGNV